MKTLLALLAALGLAAAAPAAMAAEAKPCASPKQMAGFKTCADVAKAEAEGEVVVYSTDPERGTAQLVGEFAKLFPKIKPNYVRLQAGALYAKVLSERQAKSFLVDVMQISDMGYVLDFQKRGGYRQYLSPEMAAYRKEYRSEPEGFWTWGTIIQAGIAYNSKLVSAAEAPKDWPDLLDPKWADVTNVKVSNSGLQHEVWFELRQLYPDYFRQFAAIKPRAFDSYVQQYDRLTNGEDKIIMGAQYSGYIEFKRKGAPIEFVFPPGGLPAGPEVWGIVSDTPHPNAAELFMDWLLSPLGQKALGDALALNPARDGVPPPEGAIPASQMKLLIPKDWNAFLQSRTEFANEWNRIVGVRK
jgi:iron(III) transport system substrate-binding protein